MIIYSKPNGPGDLGAGVASYTNGKVKIFYLKNKSISAIDLDFSQLKKVWEEIEWYLVYFRPWSCNLECHFLSKTF